MSDNFNLNNEILDPSAPLSNIQSNLNAQNFTNSLSLSVIKNISGWGMFRAVVDIISGSLSCLGGVIFLFISLIIFVSGGSANSAFNISSSFNGLSGGTIKLIGGIFLVCAFIYPLIGVMRIIYSVNLIKAIDHLKNALVLNNESCIIEFFNKLSKFFKFNGLVTIIKIALYVLLVGFYIVLIIFIATTANDNNIMNEFNNSSKFFQ